MRRGRHGFTLLEVIVAVFVFATVMSSLIALVSQNVRRTADASAELRATRLAEGKLRSILFDAEKGTLPDPGTNQGAFEGDDQDMAFEVAVDPFEVPLPQGASKKVIAGSGIFAGGGTSALRRIVVRVFPAEGGDPGSAAPFVAFVAEPNKPADPEPGTEGTQDGQQPGGDEQPADNGENPDDSRDFSQ